MAFNNSKDWELEEINNRILEALSKKPMSPREICGERNNLDLLLTGEEVGEFLQTLLVRGWIRVAGFKMAYLEQLKPGPNGILEATFETVR